MEEKIIKSYKGFNKDMKCLDFHYEVGKEYEMDGAIVVLDHEKERNIGSMIWENVKCVMDTESCNVVTINIDYE